MKSKYWFIPISDNKPHLAFMVECDTASNTWKCLLTDLCFSWNEFTRYRTRLQTVLGTCLEEGGFITQAYKKESRRVALAHDVVDHDVLEVAMAKRLYESRGQ